MTLQGVDLDQFSDPFDKAPPGNCLRHSIFRNFSEIINYQSNHSWQYGMLLLGQLCCDAVQCHHSCLSATTAAWCSLLCDLAVLNKLRWSSAAKHCSTASRQGSGSASSNDGDETMLAILWSSSTRLQLYEQCRRCWWSVHCKQLGLLDEHHGIH
jgi:hypothetical protein